MTIIWEIEDGYVGKYRPQKIEIPDEEFEDCESTEEIEEIIEDIVKNEFEQIVGYNWRVVSKNE